MISNTVVYLNYLWNKNSKETLKWQTAENVKFDLDEGRYEPHRKYDSAFFYTSSATTEEDTLKHIYEKIRDAEYHSDLLKIKKENGEIVYGIAYKKQID